MSAPQLPVMVRKYLKHVKPGVDKKTISIYGYALDKFVKFAGDREEVDRKFVQEFYNWLVEDGYALSSALKSISILRSFYLWACDNYKDLPFPVERIKYRPKQHSNKKKTYTEDEYRRLLVAANAKVQSNLNGEYDRFDEEWGTIIPVGWETPLRISDICIFQWNYIQFGQQAIKLIMWKTRRFNKESEIPITLELEELFKKLYNDRTDDTYVLPRYARLYKRHPQQISGTFRAIATLAGITDKTFHNFRHTWITRMLERGASPALVSDAAHISITEVMRYTHPSIESKREAFLGNPSKAYTPIAT